MCLVVNQEADGDSLGSGIFVRVRNFGNTTANGESGNNWCAGIVEVRGYRKGFCLIGRFEGSFYKQTFGMCWSM
jgi:hypothetical protein